MGAGQLALSHSWLGRGSPLSLRHCHPSPHTVSMVVQPRRMMGLLFGFAFSFGKTHYSSAQYSYRAAQTPPSH